MSRRVEEGLGLFGNVGEVVGGSVLVELEERIEEDLGTTEVARVLKVVAEIEVGILVGLLLERKKTEAELVDCDAVETASGLDVEGIDEIGPTTDGTKVLALELEAINDPLPSGIDGTGRGSVIVIEINVLVEV